MFRLQLMRYVTFFLFIFSIWSCGTKSEQNKTQEYLYIQGRAQGSTFNIRVDTQDTTVVQDVEHLLKEQDLIFSLYRDSSYIKTINQFKKAPYNQHFETVLKAAYHHFSKSKGAFNPNVYTLFKYADTAKVLNPSELKDLQKLSEDFSYEVGQDSIYFGNATRLTFDAIAQGYAVDVICDYFENKGIANYFVELGGELRVKGVNDAGQFWKVGIEHPSKERKGVYLRKVALKSGAVASSGNYRKFLNQDPNRPHTIDPRTGKPKNSDIIACTVIGKTAMEADAYATTMMAMNKEERVTYIAQEKIIVMTITQNGDKVKVEYYNGVADYMVE